MEGGEDVATAAELGLNPAPVLEITTDRLSLVEDQVWASIHQHYLNGWLGSIEEAENVFMKWRDFYRNVGHIAAG